MTSATLRKWLLVAGGALVVNLYLVGITSVLFSDRRPPQDITDPTGIQLVTLTPPTPPEPEELKEPEKPKPEPQPDFMPDLARPDLGGPPSLDLGVAISLGGIGESNASTDFVFEAYELDQPPRPVVKVPPNYPYKAREQGIEGAVQVKLLVREDGGVGQVIVVDARPKGIFEDAVLKAVPQWKFNPGTVQGEPVAAWMVQTVRFTL